MSREDVKGGDSRPAEQSHVNTNVEKTVLGRAPEEKSGLGAQGLGS